MSGSPDFYTLGTVGEPVAGRVSFAFGPVWLVESADLFQDNFPQNGTLMGPVRIDMARDINPAANPDILPGDSLAVSVGANYSVMQGFWARTPSVIPGGGLESAPDGRASVYCYVRSSGGEPPATMQAAETGKWTLLRFPCTGAGPTPGGFYQFQMDSLYDDPGMDHAGRDLFCFDLNDDAFTPPDRIDFYFSATDTDGKTVYWSEEAGHTDDQSAAEAMPMEMQCLPSGNADILYVEDSGGQGREYFDTAFQLLNVAPDRFDVRAADSCVGNSLGSRATADQVLGAYRTIIWNSGDCAVGTIGDGSGAPEKSPDAQLLNVFLDEKSGVNPGLYLSGDNIAEEMKLLASPPMVTLLGTYMNYDLLFGDHRAAGHRTTPLLIGLMPGTIFQSDSPPGEPDSLYADATGAGGGFDVLQPALTATAQMYYDGDTGHTAIVSQTTPNAVGQNARVLLSGFSYHTIADDTPEVPIDRAEHLIRILLWMENEVDIPTGGETKAVFVNGLAQNYPNPFNPSTHIHFSLSERSHVSIRVYNVLGQLVRTLVDEDRGAGNYTDVLWNGTNRAGEPVASGVYFYKMAAKNFVKTRKMVLLK
jgi:hypothetical protein